MALNRGTKILAHLHFEISPVVKSVGLLRGGFEIGGGEWGRKSGLQLVARLVGIIVEHFHGF